MIRKFRTKPFIIEAVLFTGDNEAEVQAMTGKTEFALLEVDDREHNGVIAEVFDKLHSTWVGVHAGNWIIKGQKGEFYPCDPEIFAAKYEEILSDPRDTLEAPIEKGEYIVDSKTIKRTFGTGEM